MWSVVTRRSVQAAGTRISVQTLVRSRARSCNTMISSASSSCTPVPLPFLPPVFTESPRFYVSRAHPQPIREYTIMDAVDMVLENVEERKQQREVKWERNKEKRQAKQPDDPGGYRNQDETIELALNLNLDPRKPNQALRGSIVLPHGSGKKLKCVVFSDDPEVSKQALELGAVHAGGDDLIQSIASGQVPVDFDRALATSDMSRALNKSLARILGPRGLMPNNKVGTLVTSSSDLLESLSSQIEGGPIQFRTDKTGIVHLGIGKGSFGSEKLLDNVRTVMNGIFDVKPEGNIGRAGKKASKNAKYLLKAYLTATQGKGVKLDLRTVEPTSAFFMSVPQE